MKEYAVPEYAEREKAPVRRRPAQKSAPAPSYEESAAVDSPLIRRAQRHKAEVTLRQFAAERMARQAEQGEPMSAPAPVSLPPTSTLARRLQERSGEAVAAALMRQFAAERAAREAEADAWPAPIPLRRRTAEADEPAGGVQRAETPTAALQRKDEDSVAEGAPLARLSAEVPTIPAGAATAPTVVERQDSAVARAVTTEPVQRAATSPASAPASVTPAVSAPASTAPIVERTAVPDAELAREVGALHRRVEVSPGGADGGTVGPGAAGLQRQPAAPPPVASPSGLAPLIIPSTSRQLQTLRERGGGVPLDPQTLRRMEANMRVPLGDMRIHNDPEAWTLCQRLGAQAFADGTDIYFQKGLYQPGTPQGRNLLGRQLQRAVAWRTEQQAKEAEAAQAAQALVARATEQPEAAAPIGPDAESTRQHRETGGVVQAQAEVGLAGGPLSAELSGRIQSKRGVGASLDPATRARMETAFGTSFSGVNIHTDGEADTLNRNVSAVAFTIGQDIFFRQGAYQPETPHGQQLLAHELTHVVQQRSGAAGGGSGPLTVGPAGDHHEQQADATAATVAAALHSGTNAAGHAAAHADAAAPSVARHALRRRVSPDAPGWRLQRRVAMITSPEQDPAFVGVTTHVTSSATSQKAHEPAPHKAAQAQAAAVPPHNELPSRAAAKQTDKMASREPQPFDKVAFKAALEGRIASLTPRNLEEVDNFKSSGRVSQMHGALAGQVQQGAKQADNGMGDATRETPSTAGITPKPVTPLPPANVGAVPTAPSGAAAAPKPLAPGAVETPLKANSARLDAQMSGAHVTEEQLRASNEPSFTAALDAKHQAQTEATHAPAAFHRDEAATIDGARNDATAALHKNLAGMHDARAKGLTHVTTQQQDAKGKDEAERLQVATHIGDLYTATKRGVEGRLDRLNHEVLAAFDGGATAATAAFEDGVKRRMDAYKADRYGGVLGPLKWLKDKLLGMPSEVNAFYEAGKRQFVADMDRVLDRVTGLVATGLTEAKTMIATGRQQVTTYVESLPQSLRKVGQDAANAIKGQFDGLEGEVDAAKTGLIDTLAHRYVDRLHHIEDRVRQMEDENRGLVDRAASALAGVIKTIMEFKAMLERVLARAAGVIDEIIKNPMRFLGYLIQGIGQGLKNFVARIGKHLGSGLMSWLFGVVGQAGIALPQSFDVKGILMLVAEVVGLSPQNIRARAVSQLGEPTVHGMEQGVGLFQRLMTQGPAGVWDEIRERLGDLKAMVLGPITAWLTSDVIIAGITWILSLLTPASAFIKACKAIFDIVMFFIQRGSQIMALVNAVIGTIGAVASGNVGAIATAVENALARSIPVAIGFLASLLGLGGIAEKITGFIQKIQAPINKAIDWVIGKARSLFKFIVDKAKNFAGKVGNKLGFGKNKDKGTDDRQHAGEDTRTTEQKQEALDHAIADANAVLAQKGLPQSAIREQFSAIKAHYKLTKLDLVVRQREGLEDELHAHGEVNPTQDGNSFIRVQVEGNRACLLTVIRRVAQDVFNQPAVRERLMHIQDQRAQGIGQDVDNPIVVGSGLRHPAAASDFTNVTDPPGQRTRRSKEYFEVGEGTSKGVAADEQTWSSGPGHVEVKPGRTGVQKIGRYPDIVRRLEAIKQETGMSDVELAQAVQAYMRTGNLPPQMAQNQAYADFFAQFGRLAFNVEPGRSPSALVTTSMLVGLAADKDSKITLADAVDRLNPVAPLGAVQTADALNTELGFPSNRTYRTRAIKSNVDRMMATEVDVMVAWLEAKMSAASPIFNNESELEAFIRRELQDYLATEINRMFAPES